MMVPPSVGRRCDTTTLVARSVTVIGLEILVPGLADALTFFVDVLGFELAYRGPAREVAGETAEQQKGAVSSLIGEIAEAVNSAAGELGSRDHSAAAQYANAIGSGLTNISQTLDKKSVGEIVSDVTEFARRNPAAYIGGSMLIGIALARFAVASPPSRAEPLSNPDRRPTSDHHPTSEVPL